ncbi:MAG: vitamin K epoxide reductase family protein [Acidobacteriaceae bacterium]
MRYVLFVLALAGVIVSALALQVHYSTGTEPCDINAHWDCGIVNHSSYATVPGILWHLRAARNPNLPGPAPRTGFPVAALGLIGYALIGLCALLRRRGLTLLFALCGLGFALYLSNVEAHVLEVWCLYCVISQGLIALITLLSIAGLFTRTRTT